MPIESRSPTAYGRYPALSRRRLGVFSYVSELYAGERLRLAGYSSGTGVCARGGCSARLCVPVAALCHRLMAGLAVLSRRFASAHGWPCGSVAAFCHRLTPVFFLLEEKETACDSLRSCSAGSRSPFAHSPVSARLSAFGGFTLGLRVSLWRSRREHDRSSLIRKEAPHRVGASFAMDL